MEFLSDPNVWIAFAMLTALEIVLGIDNIIFISILVGRLPPHLRDQARRLGLGFAMVSRLLLLFTLGWVMGLTADLFSLLGQGISGRDLVLLFGGLFLLYKASHEIFVEVEAREQHASRIGRAIAVVMSLLGIGIFAIPAGLLASAFSDQLHKERDALKASILRMLGDGELDEEEMALLRSEAKRLHLTVEEMNSILEVLQLEMENVRKSLLQLPVNVIAQNPLHAVEHYKYLLNQIAQLGIYVDQKAFLEKAQSEDRLTVSEVDIWKHILEHRWGFET